MTEQNTFMEIAAILGLATAIGILGQKLRQPLIIMFLVAGIVAGPAGLGIVQSYQKIELLAHIGIALLLFIVGLKLDLNLIRSTGPVALATGVGQIVFTSLIGFVIAVMLGMTLLSAAYVAVALTFSSTIIIVKLLSDKKEIDALHGQIAIGFLIVQDIAAILALVGLTTFGTSLAEGESAVLTALLIGLKGLGLLGLVAVLMRYLLPGLTRRLAHSLELLTLFAIAWAVLLGAGSDLLGFSKEVGAFLAGVSLASTEYRDAIGGRLTGLRDFLLLFFFIDLGSRLEWSAVGSQLGASLVFSLFVLVGNPLIVLIIMGWMGYRRRTGFLAGLTVAQISEFSLIVVALGLNLGHIDNQTVGLVTLVGVITIFISTYMILYSGQLYQLLSEPLKLFERASPYREAADGTPAQTGLPSVVLFGLGNYGSELAEYLLRRNRTVLGVDFDPTTLDSWRRRGLPVLYGDMADPDIHEYLPLQTARWMISSVRNPALNLALLHNLKKHGYQGNVALTATTTHEARLFTEAGAQLIFRPLVDAAEQAADALSHAMGILPNRIDWPISFLEVRIKSDAAAAGKPVREIPLHARTGTSILAVSRGGRIHYEPEPEFRIYPGDRLLLMGPQAPAKLKEAEDLLNEIVALASDDPADHFAMAEVEVAAESGLTGASLSELRFRQTYAATLVGIVRGQEQITTISPDLQLQGGDKLIVIGTRNAIGKLVERSPL